jgi:hypothetical protein
MKVNILMTALSACKKMNIERAAITGQAMLRRLSTDGVPRDIEIRSTSFVCLGCNNRTACVWDKSNLSDFPAVDSNVD